MSRLSRIAAAAVIFSSVSVDAIAFTVKPTRVYMKSEAGVEVINISNPRKTATTFSARVFEWAKSTEPDQGQPTDDLMVVPPVFEVDPLGQQVIRIAARGAIAETSEKTYRLTIQEVPSEVNNEEGVNFNFSINMPVYVTPSGAEPIAVWRLEKAGENGVSLALGNEGTSHLRLKKLSLAKVPDGPPIFSLTAPDAVFAGEARAWPLDVALNDLKGPLNLTAETQRGPIEAVVSLPQN